MITLLRQSLRMTAVFTVLAGLIYPLLVTGVAQLCFPSQANGSLLRNGREVIGARLLAQRFKSPGYFWPRPSSCGYATIPSGASNLGPTSEALRTNVAARATAFRTANHLLQDASVPGDIAFASGSGLDPHISPAAARFQVARVAASRGLPAVTVEDMVARATEPPQAGFLGAPRVNVLSLNLALDRLAGRAGQCAAGQCLLNRRACVSPGEPDARRAD